MPLGSTSNLRQTEAQLSTPALAPLMQHKLLAAAKQSTMPLDKAHPQKPSTSLSVKVPSQSYDEHQAAMSVLVPLLKHETFS